MNSIKVQEARKRYKYIRKVYWYLLKAEFHKMVLKKMEELGGTKGILADTCALAVSTIFLVCSFYFQPDIETSGVMTGGFMFSVLLLLANPWSKKQ